MRIRLGEKLTLGEIASAVGGVCKPAILEKAIEFLSTDTRELYPEDLFIPLMGERFNGEDYAESAIKKGAVVLSSRTPGAHIKVSSGSDILEHLSKYYKKTKLNPKYTVAITGSVGKTTTKEFLKTIAKTTYTVHATKENLNNNIGVPLTVLSAEPKTEILIFELGMNRRGEISGLSKIVNPDIGIITKIGTSHIGKLGSREEIAKAKLELLEGMKDGILITPFGEPLLRKSIGPKFSVSNVRADYCVTAQGGHFSAYRRSEKMFDFPFNLKGEHNIECLAAAFSAADCIGLDSIDLKRGISQITDNNARQRFKKVGNIYLLDDSYNASFESIEAALRILAQYPEHKKRAAVLGTVLELGEYSETIHTRIGELAASYGLSMLYLIGTEADAMANGAVSAGFDSKRILLFKEDDYIKKTAKAISEYSEPGELLLLKGSHKYALSKISDELKKFLGD